MRFLLLLSMLTIALFLPTPSQAQVGTMKWKFTSRAQVVPALKQTRGNLRGTYEVLICAARQGYRNTALGYYEGIVTGHEFSATVQDSAAFAFAHDLSDNFGSWNWKKDVDYKDYKGSNEAMATLFRDRAYSNGSGSPEVLIMRSYRSRYFFKENRKQAFEWASKAVKRAPKWADGHYWLAQAYEYYGLSLQASKNPADQILAVRLGQLGMLSYDRAEKLDPALKPHTYLGRIGLSQLIADKKAAQMIPVYTDAHLRAFPNYASWFKKTWGKTEQDLRKMNSQIAAQIAQKATS